MVRKMGSTSVAAGQLATRRAWAEVTAAGERRRLLRRSRARPGRSAGETHRLLGVVARLLRRGRARPSRSRSLRCSGRRVGREGSDGAATLRRLCHAAAAGRRRIRAGVRPKVSTPNRAARSSPAGTRWVLRRMSLDRSRTLLSRIGEVPGLTSPTRPAHGLGVDGQEPGTRLAVSEPWFGRSRAATPALGGVEVWW